MRPLCVGLNKLVSPHHDASIALDRDWSLGIGRAGLRVLGAGLAHLKRNAGLKCFSASLARLKRNTGLTRFNAGLMLLEKGTNLTPISMGLARLRIIASFALGAGFGRCEILILITGLRHETPLDLLQFFRHGCWELHVGLARLRKRRASRDTGDAPALYWTHTLCAACP